MVTNVTDLLCRASILARVILPGTKDSYGYQLAIDPSALTVGMLARRIDATGTSGFVPAFDTNFPGVESTMAALGGCLQSKADTILVRDIDILDKPTINQPINS